MGRRNPYRLKFVSSMLNVCHIVGFVRKPTPTGYIIQQNNSIEQGIPVRVAPGSRVPSEGTMIDATCHIFGERVNDEPNCFLSVIATEAPSVRHGLTMTAWRSGLASKSDDFQPFLSGGQLRKDIAERLAKGEKTSVGDKAVQDLLAAAGNKLDSGLGESGNKVILAGFVDLKRYVEPNPHQKHGYGELYLRQHNDRSRLIPVRIYNDDVKSILRNTARGLLVYIEGQMRMKVLPDDAGNIRHRNLHIRTDDVKPGVRDKHILQIPDWWSEMHQELVEERTSRQEAARRMEEARRTTLPQPTGELLLADLP